MSLLTLGSVAFDTLESPFGRRERTLGGSGVYASFAASFFTHSALIAAAGDDWLPEYSGLLRARGVDLEGLEIRANTKTSFWSGRYFANMNDRETLQYDGNVMSGDYIPIVPESYRDIEYVLLGNMSPLSGMALLDALHSPKLVVADTMDFYIRTMRDSLMTLLTRVDGLILNDSEAAFLTGIEHSDLRAAQRLLEFGPQFVVVKRGEYGAFWMTKEGEIYVVPAYPTVNVVDPTGAGDSFAGALLGCLAESRDLTPDNIKQALLYATVVASLNIEGFSLERFQFVKRAEIDERAKRFKAMLA